MLTRVRQQRVVEDVSRGEADAPEDEQYRRQHPVARRDEHEQPGCEDAHPGKQRKESLFAALDVRDGAEDRREDGDEQQRDAQAEAPQAGSSGLAGEGGPGNLAVVDGQHRCEDRCGKGGVGPVVERPGADAALILPLRDLIGGGGGGFNRSHGGSFKKR